MILGKLIETTHRTSSSEESSTENQLIQYNDRTDFLCNNCGNRLKESPLRRFAEVIPDKRLTCPLCMSLDIRKVKA